MFSVLFQTPVVHSFTGLAPDLNHPAIQDPVSQTSVRNSLDLIIMCEIYINN